MGGRAVADQVSCVLEIGFQLDSLLYTYVVGRMDTQLRLARNSTCAGPAGSWNVNTADVGRGASYIVEAAFGGYEGTVATHRSLKI
jgi:hypothetical protein